MLNSQGIGNFLTERISNINKFPVPLSQISSKIGQVTDLFPDQSVKVLSSL